MRHGRDSGGRGTSALFGHAVALSSRSLTITPNRGLFRRPRSWRMLTAAHMRSYLRRHPALRIPRRRSCPCAWWPPSAGWRSGRASALATSARSRSRAAGAAPVRADRARRRAERRARRAKRRSRRRSCGRLPTTAASGTCSRAPRRSCTRRRRRRAHRLRAYRGGTTRPVAWAGRPSELPLERINGPAALFIAPGPLGFRLVRIQPVVGRTEAALGRSPPSALFSDTSAAVRRRPPALHLRDPARRRVAPARYRRGGRAVEPGHVHHPRRPPGIRSSRPPSRPATSRLARARLRRVVRSLMLAVARPDRAAAVRPAARPAGTRDAAGADARDPRRRAPAAAGARHLLGRHARPTVAPALPPGAGGSSGPRGGSERSACCSATRRISCSRGLLVLALVALVAGAASNGGGWPARPPAGHVAGAALAFLGGAGRARRRARLRRCSGTSGSSATRSAGGHRSALLLAALPWEPARTAMPFGPGPVPRRLRLAGGARASAGAGTLAFPVGGAPSRPAAPPRRGACPRRWSSAGPWRGGCRTKGGPRFARPLASRPPRAPRLARLRRASQGFRLIVVFLALFAARGAHLPLARPLRGVARRRMVETCYAPKC